VEYHAEGNPESEFATAEFAQIKQTLAPSRAGPPSSRRRGTVAV
jgi:hypothetical protein